MTASGVARVMRESESRAWRRSDETGLPPLRPTASDSSRRQQREMSMRHSTNAKLRTPACTSPSSPCSQTKAIVTGTTEPDMMLISLRSLSGFFVAFLPPANEFCEHLPR